MKCGLVGGAGHIIDGSTGGGSEGRCRLRDKRAPPLFSAATPHLSAPHDVGAGGGACNVAAVGAWGGTRSRGARLTRENHYGTTGRSPSTRRSAATRAGTRSPPASTPLQRRSSTPAPVVCSESVGDPQLAVRGGAPCPPQAWDDRASGHPIPWAKGLPEGTLAGGGRGRGRVGPPQTPGRSGHETYRVCRGEAAVREVSLVLGGGYGPPV